MTRRKITKEEVEAALLAQCEAHPGKRNPTMKGAATCLYTDPRNSSRHCVVGQYLADLGLPVPGPDCLLGWFSMQKEDHPLALEGLTEQ